jgi:hypothetical protein
MAAQVFYPDDFNGAYIACPDPIDFRAFTVVNLYEDRNAYYIDSAWKRTPRPGRRNYLGHVDATLEEMNQLELVLGTRTFRSAVGCVGGHLLAGRPRWLPGAHLGQADRRDRSEGRRVLARELRPVHILRRDWDKGLGAKLQGKLHIYVGDMDNYYLNNAVYLVEEFLEEHHLAAVRGRSGLRRPRRALLERRPDAPQRAVAPALSPDVPPQRRCRID